MEDRKKANTTNDNLSLKADALTDLPITNEQADETKGGALPHVKVFSGIGSSGATGDVNGDGFADLIVGAGVGGHVK